MLDQWVDVLEGPIARLIERRRPDLLPTFRRFDARRFLAATDPDERLGSIADRLIALLDRGEGADGR